MSSLGTRASYFLRPGYRARRHPRFFDDTPFAEEFQREVYQYAQGVLLEEGFRSVCDVGCGSGFKLMKYFPQARTLGLDLLPTVLWLQTRYPARQWRAVDLARDSVEGYELAIAADVIEHLPDPDEVLGFLERMGARRIILSTPERDLLCSRDGHDTQLGPPRNMHHAREWNAAEFAAYVACFFRIRRHWMVESQQIVDCEPRG